MTKKKSLLTLVLAVCLIVPAIFMLTACGGNKNDPEDTKTEAVITLDNAYVLTKTYDGQTVENPTETQITKDSDGEMTIEWYAGEIKLEEGPKNAGNYKLVISTAETDTYKAGKLEKMYTINKKQLTISGTTVEDKEYDGNNTATVTAGTLAGLVGGDEVSVGVTATGTFASKDVAYGLDVDPQDVTISYALTGDLAKNYFAPVDETKPATINPKPLVNVNLMKVYDGDGIFDRTALTTEQGIVAGESIEIYVNATGANVGVYKDGNKDANFGFNDYVLYIGDSEEQTVNYAWGDSCTATITAKQLTVTANTVIKYYDGTTDFSQSVKTANVEGI
ncbi:MAG: YDG domain-containing protein, partial [Eubacteriales bacterium]|nr:YDG domain-containing protein [Eubacteriales bacterium]